MTYYWFVQLLYDMISEIIDPASINPYFSPSTDSESLGIQTIMKRYSSNSITRTLPNQFATLTKNMSGDLNQQAIFYGNLSDLWGLLNFQIKSIHKILQHQMDLGYIMNNVKLGQILMLSLAEKNTKNTKMKLEILGFYLEKINDFKREIIKQNSNKIIEKFQYRNIISTNQTTIQKVIKNHPKKQDFIFAHSDEKFFVHILPALSSVLKILLLSIRKMQKKTEIVKKGILKVKILSLHLLFLLKNRSWQKLCLSGITVTNNLMKFLIQYNGATKISKYLNDASPDLLNQESNEFCQTFL